MEDQLEKIITKYGMDSYFPVPLNHDLTLELWGYQTNFRIESLEDGEYAIASDFYRLKDLKKNEKSEIQEKIIHLVTKESTKNNISEFRHRNIVYKYKPRIIFEEYPYLQNSVQNRDNLFPLDEINYIEESGICISERVIFPHHNFFRRSEHFENNFNGDLINSLINLSKNDDISIKIKLNEDYLYSTDDLDIIRNYYYLELDHWFGPKFNSDFKKIKSGSGFLKFPYEIKKNYYNIDGIAYRVIPRDDRRILEFIIEEFCSPESTPFIILNDNRYFKTKFVHSELNLENNTIQHFDPAFKFYNSDIFNSLIKKRKENPSYMMKTPNYYYDRHPGKIKVYRCDGKISLQEFQENIYNFFRGNVLLQELFEDRKIWEEPKGIPLTSDKMYLSAGFSGVVN